MAVHNCFAVTDESSILSLLNKNSVFGISNVTTSLDFDKTIAGLSNSAVSSLVNYTSNVTSDHSDAVEVEFDEASLSIIFPYNSSVYVGVKALACGQSTAANTTIQLSEYIDFRQ